MRAQQLTQRLLTEVMELADELPQLRDPEFPPFVPTAGPIYWLAYDLAGVVPFLHQASARKTLRMHNRRLRKALKELRRLIRSIEPDADTRAIDRVMDANRALGSTFGMGTWDSLLVFFDGVLGTSRRAARIVDGRRRALTWRRLGTLLRVARRRNAGGDALGRRFTSPLLARCFVGLAVNVLPSARRDRYAEEFTCELRELPRRKQSMYSVRLLLRCWALRRALSDPDGVTDGA